MIVKPKPARSFFIYIPESRRDSNSSFPDDLENCGVRIVDFFHDLVTGTVGGDCRRLDLIRSHSHVDSRAIEPTPDLDPLPRTSHIWDLQRLEWS